MNIGTLNCSNVLKESLIQLANVINLDEYSNFPSEKLNGIFIDWVSNEQNPTQYKKQGAFLDKYLNSNIIILIFDRYFILEDWEIERLQEYKNVFLYEPRLITRVGFSYMPFCCKIPDEVPLYDDEKQVSLGFKDKDFHSDKIKEFDYYYLEYAKFSGNNVYYDISNLNSEKNKLYQENGLINTSFDYSQCKCSIIIGSKEEYYTGFLPEKVFDIISQGCLPLLPESHIYFYGLFKDLIVENMKDIDWYVRYYPAISYGSRVNFYERIEKHFPLFNVTHLANYIMSMIKE